MVNSRRDLTPQDNIGGTEVAQYPAPSFFDQFGADKQRTAPGKDRQFPKTDLRYWMGAVYKREYEYGGKTMCINHYCARIQHDGKRVIFSLHTSNRNAAAAKARTIYLYLLSSGWAATLEKFKPAKEPGTPNAVETIGQLITAILGSSTAHKQSLFAYAQKLRTIVAHIFGIEGGKKRFDYRKGGRDEWRSRIDAIPLSKLTGASIQRWKVDFIARAGNNPKELRTARISANSILRQASSLFAPKHLEGVVLPPGFSSPFQGVKFEPRQSMRYQSSFDVERLLTQALEELSASEPEKLKEMLKVVLLAAMAGLRRGEIDKLLWSAFNWERGTVRITTTEHFRAKSQDSIGEVDLDSELLTLFKRFEAERGAGLFVIESPIHPRPDAAYSHYRCERIFDRTIRWLRAHGVKGKSPLHTLRKEYGSVVCQRFGIYAASQALRHADITITSQHYLDKKQRVTPGLGHVLNSGSGDLS
jgi:integrase